MKMFLILSLLVFNFNCAKPTKIDESALPVASFHADLPGAPKLHSAEDQSDYQTLLSLQHSRTKAECKRGNTEVKISLASFYGAPYGPLTQEEVSNWQPWFEALSERAWPLISDAKKEYQRERPYLSHSDLHPCVPHEKSFSYPSAHAAISHYYMHILETVLPARKLAIEKRAEEIAHDRNIVGVHYPSDVRDGKRLGDEIFEFLSKDQNFQKLLAEGTHAN